MTNHCGYSVVGGTFATDDFVGIFASLIERPVYMIMGHLGERK